MESESYKDKSHLIESEIARKIEAYDQLASSYKRVLEDYEELRLAKGGETALQIEKE